VKSLVLRFASGVMMACLSACAGGAPRSAGPAGTPPAPSPAAPAASSANKAEAVPVSETARAVVDAPDRSEADRKLDGGRHPAEMLSFFQIRPGMKVAEIATGGGYTTELLARAVGSLRSRL